MGIFDWVSFRMDCPVCGTRVGGFQSKDRWCPDLDTLSIDRLTNFYSSCHKCSTWIEFSREPNVVDHKSTPSTEEYARSLGFTCNLDETKGETNE